MLYIGIKIEDKLSDICIGTSKNLLTKRIHDEKMPETKCYQILVLPLRGKIKGFFYVKKISFYPL